MRLHLTILTLFCIVLYYTNYSQQYSFVNYSVKDGLPQNQIYTITSDDLGYLWFGSAGGASKFNGETFVSYSTANGLVDNVVNEIINYKGFIWIFTNTGVTRINNQQVLTYDLVDYLSGSYIESVGFTADNSLLISIKNKNILNIPVDEEVTLMLDQIKSLEKPLGDESSIRKIYLDKNDNIWLASNGFIGYLNPIDQWQSIIIENSDYNASDIIQDDKGTYWISIYDEGVYKFKPGESINLINSADGLISNLPRSLYQDRNENIWVSSKNGVSVISPFGKVDAYDENSGLYNPNIEMVYEDFEGNVWLASDGSGAFRFTSNDFVNYDKNSVLATDYIMSLTQDSIGDYWLGTYGSGIIQWNAAGTEYYNVENGKITNNNIWTNLRDYKGRLWFGSSNGLFLFSDNEITTLRNESWLPSNKITSLYQHEAELWIGTKKGLSIIRDSSNLVTGSYIKYPLKNIRTIERGPSNRVWLGTSNGIFVTDGDYIEPWIYNKQLADQVIYTIENHRDSVWFIGTSNGLYSFTNNKLKRLFLNESFSANYINFIHATEETLWVGTNYGIFEIKIKPYLQDNTKGIIHHTTSSGLQSLETNLNAVYQDKSGLIWMGTGGGLIQYDKNRRASNLVIENPRVFVKDVQLFQKETNWQKLGVVTNPYSELPVNLSLSYRKNYLTFIFESINYKNHDDVLYSVKLEGFDTEWSPALKLSAFTYTNLPYGNFVFKVKASSDGVNWSAPASYSFTIRKPYYLTNWFIIGLVLVLFLILLAVYKVLKNISERKKVSERLEYKSKLLALEQQTLNASMNRHFIFNALNSIQYYINKQDRLSANRYLTSFAKLIRKNLDSSVTKTGLVTLADELERLELYIELEHMRFNQKFDFEINVEESIPTDEIQIPAMILQPFVENSIWHGILPQDEGGKILIDIKRRKHMIVFIIEDNGVGIDESRKLRKDNHHNSQGMLITSGRMDILKKVNEKKMTIIGPYQINDKDGSSLGTRVEITLENLTVNSKK